MVDFMMTNRRHRFSEVGELHAHPAGRQFMMNNEAGRAAWPEIGIPDNHHGLAHLDQTELNIVRAHVGACLCVEPLQGLDALGRAFRLASAPRL